MSDTPLNPRQLAVDICIQVVDKGLSLSDLLERHLGRLAERDRGFCSELCYGFCRYYYVLEERLKLLLARPLKSRDRDVQVIIMLGLYQIRFMRVEDHAAVNESVRLLKKRRKLWAKGLVNALLRSFIRGLPSVQPQERAQLTAQEHRRAYPQWMRDKISQHWGEAAERVFSAGNQRAPMVLRVDTQRISITDYLQQLQDQSIEAQPHPQVEQAVVLEAPVAVELLPGFSNALVSVQDAAAQLAAPLLDCHGGMKVLDACAAPGGKTLHILQSVKKLQLTALDKDQDRLQRVDQNLQRAALAAKLICADAADTQSWFDGHLYDRILLDAPCSASGIIRRHPDIRLLRRQEDVATLVQQQQRLLNSLWPLLKPGGRLVYSTCSIFKEENEYQVQQFLQSRDNGVELTINSVQYGLKRAIGLQILPGYDQMDGFYYACLGKKEQ